MVSASKMKKAQDLALNGQPYSEQLRRVLIALLSTASNFEHYLLKPNESADSILCIFVTTNKGLCGGLNTNHFRRLNAWKAGTTNIDFITLGKKGLTYLAAVHGNVIADYSQLPDPIDFSDIVPVVKQIMDLYKQQKYQKIL